MLTRKFLTQLHLYIAAFVAPYIILLAITGGAYLLGFKGETQSTVIVENVQVSFNEKSQNLESEIKKYFELQGIEENFDYLKFSGKRVITRPTSKSFYVFDFRRGGLTLEHHEPNFMAALIEVHKGHGAQLLKYYQILVGICLLIIVLSGVIMGIQAKPYKKPTIFTLLAGFILILILF